MTRVRCGGCQNTTFHLQEPDRDMQTGVRMVWLLCNQCGAIWLVKAGLLAETKGNHELPYNKRLEMTE